MHTGSECDEEELDYKDSDSDESWTMEIGVSSEAILRSMCMNGDDEKPFACPVPGCKKRYKVQHPAVLLASHPLMQIQEEIQGTRYYVATPCFMQSLASSRAYTSRSLPKVPLANFTTPLLS